MQLTTPPSRPLRRVIAAFIALCVLASSCSSDPPEASGDAEATSGAEGEGGDGGEASSQGVTVRTVSQDGPDSDTTVLIDLAEAQASQTPDSDRVTTVDGSPLTGGESAELLDRLPDLEAPSGDQVDFNRPPDTRPRPRPGTILDQVFPAEGSPDVAEVVPGELEVLRYQPEGPVDLAPFISVTFNQPMVALSTVDQVEAADVPITISPEMPGRWIWLGTRTVRFEYAPGAIDRIPAATDYTVTIDAGTTSATGAELAEPVNFSFSTPAPTVTAAEPINEFLRTDPLFFIRFDQRVDPEAALEVIELTADGESVEVRLAEGEEVLEDAAVAPLVEAALPDRSMVIRPVEPLPTDAAIQLTIGPAIPSAEGPATSDQVFSYSGRTYGPLRIIETRCGWDGRCQPGQPLSIVLSNPIEPESFTADMISIEPAVPGLQAGVNGNEITLNGRTAGRTTYTVTLRAGLRDIYGQQLEEDATATFEIGDADPGLFRPNSSLVTLDPIVDDKRLHVTSVNNDELLVKVYTVDPREDWQTYVENGWPLSIGEFRPDWELVEDRTVTTGAKPNEFHETALDLAVALEASGHVVVVVSPTARRDEDWQNQPFAVWVQSTTLGLDAITDNADAIVWVTDLTTGEAIQGAEVEMIGGTSGTTDGDGVARIPLPRPARGLIVEADGQTALIGDFYAERWDRSDEARWYVTDDRGLYKPGETVRVKGWVRQSDVTVPAQLSLPRDNGTVTWSATDAFGNQIGTGEATLSPLGGFDIEIELPRDITLGGAGLQLNTSALSGVSDANYWHQIQVQEFRRPEFEVKTSVTDNGPYLAQEAFRVDATAAYFAGGPLGSSPVDWTVSGSATSYSPPNWPDYTFGVWVPWWLSFGGGFEDSFGGFGGGFGTGTVETLSSRTDAAGLHGLAVTIDTEGKPRPVSVSAAATVTDVNRQPITGTATALVHPSELYVGLRGARTFVQEGERLDLDVIVTDIDGEIVSGRSVTVESIRLEWRFQNGTWEEVEVPDETCETTSADEPTVCTFRPSQGGRYRIAATVVDDNERENLTELTRWVAGGDAPTSRTVDLEQLTLIPSGETFQPGDTAEILVQAPFVDAHGLLVISRGSIDRTQTFEFDDSGSAVVTIPVTSDDIPGIGLQFEVVGTAPRSAGGEVDPDLPVRPAYAAGQLTLTVPADERELTIDVAPRTDTLEPGRSTQVDVRVTDADGEPVADAELAVIVVDEAVLSLTAYQLRNPLDAFYAMTGGFVSTFRGRATVLLSDPSVETPITGQGGDDATNGGGDLAETEEAALEDSDGAAAGAPAPAAEARAFAQEEKSAEPTVELRSDFEALAVFEPEVRTDADGKATVDVPLPDSLTRYRVMVIATADATKAGSGESNITAQLPVTVRPTPPRFANFGDVFEFPVVVQNLTDESVEVDVALRLTNLAVDGRDGTTVTVPANDRVEVRFDVSAVEAGTARYQVVASAGSLSDAAEGSFPVYTPATAEAFATYGVVDSGSIAQPFAEPTGVFAQFGGLQISTSSTAVAALTDAVIYLSEYRYESSDAFASRIIAIVSLDDILAAFDVAELPSPDELRSAVNGDVDRLSSMQNGDGGFPYWQRGRESIPYNTVQATHALVLAKQAGYAVDEQVLLNAQFYLANIEDFYPPYYDEAARRAISAYALHVRLLAGDRDVDKATSLYNSVGEDDIELDVAAWLWPILADTELDAEIELLLNNRVTETPNAATFATSYGEQAWVLLHSDRRTDAIVLDALISQRPESDLVLKTLNGLLAARDRQGHWLNVQENSFVLLAGAAYFEAFEGADPDFVARAWLGDTYAVEHAYEGRTTDRNVTLVPMSELVGVGDTDIVVAKDGTDGRLYYRLGLRYAPTDFDLEPRDQGFVVQRVYEAVDDEGDVVRNDDGTWTVEAGARVRVRVTMVADSRRTHVALIDPIPAGFEIVNPALATSEPVPQTDPSDPAARGYWWYQWFDHQNARDDRAEAFATWLEAGSYEYTYIARATTPGTFVTPPTRAEQMYEPEVFGRSASTTVVVE